MRIHHLAFAVTLLGLSAPLYAQSTDGPPDTGADMQGDRISIGVGAAVVPSYEGSNDFVIVPGAAIQGKVKGHNFWSRGLQLSGDLIPDNGSGWHVQAGPTIGLRLNRTGRIGDERVEALGKRKVALEVGGFVGLTKTGVITSAYDSISARVTVVHDVSGIYGGTVITPSINYGTPLSRHAYVGLSGSMDFVGDDYARTYFTVTPAGSVASGLSAFNAKGGLKSYSLSIMGARSITGDLTHGWALVGFVGYTRLLNDFSASPIVSQAGSPNQWTGAIGVGYTF